MSDYTTKQVRVLVEAYRIDKVSGTGWHSPGHDCRIWAALRNKGMADHNGSKINKLYRLTRVGWKAAARLAAIEDGRKKRWT